MLARVVAVVLPSREERIRDPVERVCTLLKIMIALQTLTCVLVLFR